MTETLRYGSFVEWRLSKTTGLPLQDSMVGLPLAHQPDSGRNVPGNEMNWVPRVMVSAETQTVGVRVVLPHARADEPKDLQNPAKTFGFWSNNLPCLAGIELEDLQARVVSLAERWEYRSALHALLRRRPRTFADEVSELRWLVDRIEKIALDHWKWMQEN